MLYCHRELYLAVDYPPPTRSMAGDTFANPKRSRFRPLKFVKKLSSRTEIKDQVESVHTEDTLPFELYVPPSPELLRTKAPSTSTPEEAKNRPPTGEPTVYSQIISDWDNAFGELDKNHEQLESTTTARVELDIPPPCQMRRIQTREIAPNVEGDVEVELIDETSNFNYLESFSECDAESEGEPPLERAEVSALEQFFDTLIGATPLDTAIPPPGRWAEGSIDLPPATIICASELKVPLEKAVLSQEDVSPPGIERILSSEEEENAGRKAAQAIPSWSCRQASF